MQINKKYLVIALLFIYIFTLTLSTIGFVHAATIYDYVIPAETVTLSGGYSYNLYLDDNTPLTLGYLKDNPDFTITISSSSGNTPIKAMRTNDISYSLANAKDGPVELNYNNQLSIINSVLAQRGDEIWDYPIQVSSVDTLSIITISVVGYVNPDETEPTEPEETTPVVPDDGTDEGEDTAGLLDNLLSGIKSFFTELFKPITDFIDNWNAVQDSGLTFWDAIEELYEYVKGYTFDPVLEFFDSIVKNDAVLLVVQIWDFPIISQLLIVTVAIAVFSGLIRLLITL